MLITWCNHSGKYKVEVKIAKRSWISSEIQLSWLAIILAVLVQIMFTVGIMWKYFNLVKIQYLKPIILPWLMRLSGLSAGLRTKGLQVWFPVRVHAWVACQLPRWGRAKGNQSMFLSYMNVSLPPSLLSKDKQKFLKRIWYSDYTSLVELGEMGLLGNHKFQSAFTNIGIILKYFIYGRIV